MLDLDTMPRKIPSYVLEEASDSEIFTETTLVCRKRRMLMMVEAFTFQDGLELSGSSGRKG